MAIFLTVQGNSDPKFELTLERDNVVIDLTDASAVSLIIKNRDTGTITNTGHQACDILTPHTAGKIRYTPEIADFPAEAIYVGQVKITRTSGRVERVPELVQFPASAKFDT